MSIFYLSDSYLLGIAGWLVVGLFSFWLLLKLRRRLRSRSRLRDAVHAGLSLWMLLTLLTALELYFALMYDTTDSFNMTNVSKKWFDRHVRSQQRQLIFSDNQGMLYRDDRAIPKTVSPDQQHICFVGDSFTFGHGVPNVADRFSNRIRTALDAEYPGRFVISNLAEAGKDLLWVEMLLQELFQDGFQIHTVVYVLCLNDIEGFYADNLAFYNNLGLQEPQWFLFRDTYFLNMLYFRAQQFTLPEVRDYYSHVREYYSGEPWLAMQDKLTDVHQLCINHGAQLRVVLFPFLHNLGEDYPFRDIHAKLVESCHVTGIATLDLEPVLSPHVSEGLIVNRFDAHPNERAHALVAAALREWLVGDGTFTLE